MVFILFIFKNETKKKNLLAVQKLADIAQHTIKLQFTFNLNLLLNILFVSFTLTGRKIKLQGHVNTISPGEETDK